MIIDIIVLAVLLISAVIAFLRGFIREVLTIAGVVGGIAAAYFGGPLLTPHMNTWLGVESGVEPERLFGVIPYDVMATALSYGAIFITVVLILSFVSHFLAETAQKFGLGAIDRTLGFIFGLIRGVLLLGLLYLPVHLFIDEETKDTYLKDTQSLIYLEKTSEALSSFIPENVTKNMEDDVEKITETLDTREKLEEIDLLKEHKERTQQETTNQSNESEAGYSDVIRREMDQLIEETMQSPE